MQLREAEALGVVDDHDGRVGHVDAHLDDGGRHEAVVLFIFEGRHDPRLLLVLHFAVQQGEVHAGQAVFEGIEQLGHAHERALLVPLDLGADEVALVALFGLGGDIFEHVVVFMAGDDRRDDGRARLGLVADLGDIEVAVEDERESARDGRRRHDEHIRARPLFAQRAALGDAEAVLLVADAEGERLGLHVRLQQGVRADGDVDLPRGERPLDLALFLGGGGTCEEGDAHFGHIPADEGKVLRGEHLGGRDHRRLIAALCGHVHAAQRDGRLAAADISLQQPVHAVRPGAVRQNIGDRLVLPVGEGEGEAGDEGCHVLLRT